MKKVSNPINQEVQNLVVVGDPGVGKSALIIQFIKKNLNPVYNDYFEYSSEQVTIDSKTCRLAIYDTKFLELYPNSGHQEEHLAQKEYRSLGNIFLCVYSIASKISFEEIKIHYDQMRKYQYHSYSVPMILVGNKCDLQEERRVSTAEGQDLANNFGCPFFETSAIEGINIEEVFYEAVREVRKYQKTCKAQRKRNKPNACSFA